MLLPKGHHREIWRKPSIEDVSNLISISPTNPIEILNLHGIALKILFCSSYIFDINESIDAGSGAHGKDRKYCRDRANIVNPKVAKVVPHSQPVAPQQTVRKIHLDPQYNIFHWGSTIKGVSTLWPTLSCTPLGYFTGTGPIIWRVCTHGYNKIIKPIWSSPFPYLTNELIVVCIFNPMWHMHSPIIKSSTHIYVP